MSLFRDSQALCKYIPTIHPKWKMVPSFFSVQPNSTGVVASLYNISLGTGNDQRIGRVTQVKGLHIVVFTGDNLTALPTTMRFSFFIDKNPNQSTPVYNDVFTAYGTPTPLNSLQHWKDRFIPLKDYYRVYGPSKTNFNSSPYAEYVDEWIPLDFEAVFGSSNIPATNNIILTYSGSTPIDPNNPDLAVFTEIYYTDE